MTIIRWLIPAVMFLLPQVCEERLQFSLSENVKTNVLWGSTVKDTVTLRPWGEQIKENSAEVVTEDEENQEERYGEADSMWKSCPELRQRKEASAVPSTPSSVLLKSALFSLLLFVLGGFRSHVEQERSPSTEPQSDEMPEPLTVIEQDEVPSPQPAAATASQAMKGTWDHSRGFNMAASWEPN